MNRLNGALTFLAALLLTSACVEHTGRPTSTPEDSDGSTATSTKDPCRIARDLEYFPIQDFEFGIATQWWVSTDETGEINHMAGREPSAEALPDGRCGISRYALHIEAEGLKTYGGALGFNYYLDPHDITEWDGISLWARRGDNSGKSLFVALSDKYTDEVNGKLLFEDGKPYCLETTDDDRLKCDRFGIGIGLDTEWRLFKVPFSVLKQRGYGVIAPELDISGILGLSIGFESGDWNFWIDDVAFYREK